MSGLESGARPITGGVRVNSSGKRLAGLATIEAMQPSGYYAM